MDLRRRCVLDAPLEVFLMQLKGRERKSNITKKNSKINTQREKRRHLKDTTQSLTLEKTLALIFQSRCLLTSELQFHPTPDVRQTFI